MPAVVIPNAAQLRLIWSLTATGHLGINVLGVSKPAGVTITQTLTNTIGAAVKAAVASSGLGAELVPAASLTRVGLRDVTNANMPEFFDTGAAVPGTGTGDPVPRQVALVVTLRTAQSGHSFRGRVYLGGFTETANQAGGNAAASTTTASGSFITAVKNALIASGMDLAVLARPSEARTETVTVTHADGTTSSKTKSHAARPGRVTPVTAIEVRNASWDSQRRRTSVGSTSTLLSLPEYLQSFEEL